MGLKWSRSTPGELDDVIRNGRDVLKARDIDVVSLRMRRLIHRTARSTVAVYGSDVHAYIVKRTLAEICQPETVRRLVEEGEIIGWSELSVSIDAPLAVWTAGSHLCEIRRLHRGITIDRLILKNRYKIRGEFLGRLHNAFVYALDHLHDLGVIHRDIQPRNIMLTDNGNIILLDSTLACAIGTPQVPVNSISYTAPEQRRGQASFASDYYSLAATEYFLANGAPPDAYSPRRFREGLARVDFGEWYTVAPDLSAGREELDLSDRNHGLFLAALLDENEGRRPTGRYELELQTHSRPVFPLEYNIRAVLDTMGLGYLVCGWLEWGLIGEEAADGFFKKVLATEGSSPLDQDIESHLSGKPRWLL